MYSYYLGFKDNYEMISLNMGFKLFTNIKSKTLSKDDKKRSEIEIYCDNKSDIKNFISIYDNSFYDEKNLKTVKKR